MYDCHNLAWIDLSHNYLVNLAYVNQLKKKKNSLFFDNKYRISKNFHF